MGSCVLEPRWSPFGFDAGDVCAARDLAVELLGRLGAAGDHLVETRLLLTAACLHLSSGVGPDPTQAEAEVFVAALAVGDRGVWGQLATSPLPFLRYAALEFCEGIEPSAAELAVRAIQSLRAQSG